MNKIEVVFWRDIPAQVIVKERRNVARRQLSLRFQEAIDRAAMKAGLYGSDDYLNEWRKLPEEPVAGSPDSLADELIQRMETEFDQARLELLVKNGGWEADQAV